MYQRQKVCLASAFLDLEPEALRQEVEALENKVTFEDSSKGFRRDKGFIGY